MHNICELPHTSLINHINILSMKRIIWRGNRAHDLMSMQRAGQASFFASQFDAHFDAHELTLKSCSYVLDRMQIRFDANRVSSRSLPSERFHRSEICARGSSLHFYTAFAIAISCKKETSLSNIYHYIAYSVPVSIAIRSYLRRLRPQYSCTWRRLQGTPPSRKSTSLSSAFFHLPIAFSLSFSLKDYLNLPGAAKDFRLFSRDPRLSSRRLCFVSKIDALRDSNFY